MNKRIGLRLEFALAVLFFIVAVSPQATRGQSSNSVGAFLECVTPDPSQGGAMLAYYGYNNATSSTINIPVGTSANQFIPLPANRSQPSSFAPGVHHFVFSAQFPTGTDLVWALQSSIVPANANSRRCVTQTFTYQGRLTDSNAAANGTYQMQFSVFDAQTGGNQISATVQNTNVSVTNGVFTAPINLLTSTAFTGEDRWLEISVKKPADANYTTLSPRQQINAAPYALHSQSAATADFAANSALLGSFSVNNFVFATDPRLSDARTPTAGSSNYIQNTTTQQANTNFNISGNGTIGGNLTVNGTLTASLGQSANTVYGSGSLIVNDTMSTYMLIPGLTQTVNVPANSSIVIATDGGIQSQGAVASTFSIIDMAIFIDGAVVQNAGQRRIVVGNNPVPRSVGNWSLSLSQTLSAGPHTVEVRTRCGISGSTPALVSGDFTAPLLQGQLTVAIIKK